MSGYFGKEESGDFGMGELSIFPFAALLSPVGDVLNFIGQEKAAKEQAHLQEHALKAQKDAEAQAIQSQVQHDATMTSNIKTVLIIGGGVLLAAALVMNIGGKGKSKDKKRGKRSY